MTRHRKTSGIVATVLGLLCLAVSPATGTAQNPPTIQSIQPQTNGDVRLQSSTTPGFPFLLETSTDLLRWDPLATLKGGASVTATDSAAPYFSLRYYRLKQLTDTNAFVGDHFQTTEGDLVVRPVNHASFVFRWNGRTVYNDPVGGASPYSGLPRPDLILVSHSHGDHFDAGTLTAVRTTNTLIIAPAAVYSSLSTALKAQTIPLSNGSKTNLFGMEIEAVPAYNANHPKGAGNGYVVTTGGKRLYMSGDTGDIPEMRALQNVDVAFVCMNLPFTMSVNQAVSAVREFRPRVIYPYHYRNSGGDLADLNSFKRQISTDLGVEVRQRAWY